MEKLTVFLVLLMLSGFSFAEKEKHPDKEKVVKVSIGEDGFSPSQIEGNKGDHLILLITRTTDKTCMKELKNIHGDGETKLPLNKEIRFKVGRLEKSGEIKLLCGMDMTAGVVRVL